MKFNFLSMQIADSHPWWAESNVWKCCVISLRLVLAQTV